MSVIRNFIKSPVRYPWMVFKKIFVYPFRYRREKGYDAGRYWDDRLKKYGPGLKGVGEEGRSEEDNRRRYERVCETFRQVCMRTVVNFSDLKVLEIGTGTGQMTQVLYELGVNHYRGGDITPALFPGLQEKFCDRDFSFFSVDISRDLIEGKYELVVMIDVIEHIVEGECFRFAMENLKNCMNPRGKIIIAPLVEKGKKIQFYEKHWGKEDLKNIFADLKLSDVSPWEPGFSEILVFEKQ